MSRLNGKVAIVTGIGAGQNHEIGKALADAGAEVIEVSAEPDWPVLIDQVTATYGGLDILVNHPGTFRSQPLSETDAALFDELFTDNVERAFVAIQAVMPAMTLRGGGSIVNIGSRLGVRGLAGATAYCAAQGALTQLTLAAALDGASRKIRVNIVHAGTDAGVRAGKGLSVEPSARELDGVVVYLASDEARLVTGSELTVDGGANAA
jgi:NAD(P)-dependent dehydrogenase (short-subunit alcohol dehydrogenase family)